MILRLSDVTVKQGWPGVYQYFLYIMFCALPEWRGAFPLDIDIIQEMEVVLEKSRKQRFTYV